MSHPEQHASQNPVASESDPEGVASSNGHRKLPRLDELSPYRILPKHGSIAPEQSDQPANGRGLPERPIIHPNGDGPEDYGEELDPDMSRGVAEARLAELRTKHDELDRIARGWEATGKERVDASIALHAHSLEIVRWTRFLDSLGPETPIAASETSEPAQKEEVRNRAIGSLGLATNG